MPRALPNYRLVKIHRSYTVGEVAALLAVHRNTVREWLKRGLPRCDDRRPLLIVGRDLTAFLQARRSMNKRPCAPGEIYCVRCRVPRNPAGDMAEYQPLTATLGSLVGICPTCDALIYRRVNRTGLERARGRLEIVAT
jgi:excisionase family DNA binding protein